MTSNLPPSDPKVINDIADKLKKQGIFDKFRKDCLADVDTRPAYQNLRQRVEVFVKRFLSNKKWTPELNKNKLRESLRKEITQAPMLSTGVGHIVEQVVNPKIYKVFKPEIDAVVCECLGIDLNEREEKIRLRRELQHQQRQQELAQQQRDHEANANFSGMNVPAQQFPGTQNFSANMMDMAFGMTNALSGMAPTMNPMLATAMGQSMQNQLSQTLQPNALFPNMPPTMPNFSLPPPGFGTTQLPFNFSLPPPGMNQNQVPGSYAGMQQTFSTASSFPQVPGLTSMTYPGQVNMMTSMVSAAQPAIPGYPMQGIASMSNMATTMTSTMSTAQTMGTQPAVSMETVPMPTMTQTTSEQKPTTYESVEEQQIPEKKEREKKKEPEPLTVEDLLNIPLPHKQQHTSSKPKEVKKTDLYKDKHRERRDTGRSSPVLGQSKRDSSKPERRDDWKSENRSHSESDRRNDKKSESRSYSDSSRGRYEEGGRKEHRASKDHRDNKEYRDSKDYRDGKDYRDSKSHRDGRDHRDSKDHREKDLKDQRDSKDYKDREQRDTREDRESKESSKSSTKTEVKKKELPPEPPPEPKPENEPPKVYQFAWDNMDQGDLSDVSISSVHTSDLSSFDEQTDVESGLEDISSDEFRSDGEEPVEEKPTQPPVPTVTEVPKPKPRKLVALQYNYSDSEDDETREERKSRIAREKEHRYLRRQQRRAELEAKRKGRDEEKRREIAKKETCKEEVGASVTVVAGSEREPEVLKADDKARPRRTKEALKEQLREKKREKKVQQMVMDKRMALRRQRKRNSKYMSEEFTSIFTDKKQVLSNEGYVESTATSHNPGCSDYSQGVGVGPQSPSTPTQDEVEYSAPDNEVTLTTEPETLPVYDIGMLTHVTRSRSKQAQEEHSQGDRQSAGRPSTPFSDISEASKTESVGESRGRRPGKRRLMSGRQSPEPEEKKVARSKSPNETSRRLNQRYDPLDLYKPRLSWRRARSPAPQIPPMDPSTLCMETDDVKKSAESERAQSQRYDDSDLYKPHTSYRSRRRGASPVAKETAFSRSRSPSPSHAISPGDRRGYGARRGARPPSPSRVRGVSPTRGQQQSPIRVRSVSPGRSVPPSPGRGRPPSPSAKEDRPIQRYSGGDTYRAHGQTQRGSRYPVDRSPAKFGAQASPDRAAIKFAPRAAPSSPEHSAKFSGHLSPECGSTKSGSDDGSDRRQRRPLDMVDFGEAEKQTRRQRCLRGFGEAAWRTGLPGPASSGAGGRWSGPNTGSRGQCQGGRGQGPAGRGQTMQRPYRRGGSSPRGEHHSFRGTFQRERFHRGPHSTGGPSTPERDFQGGWSRQRSLSSQDEEDRPLLLKPKSLEEEKEEWEPISDEDDDLGDNSIGDPQSPMAEGDSGSAASVGHHDSSNSQETSIRSHPRETDDLDVPHRSTSESVDDRKDSHREETPRTAISAPEETKELEKQDCGRTGESTSESRQRTRWNSPSHESHPQTPPPQGRPMSPPLGEPISSPESGEVGDFESLPEKPMGRSPPPRSLTPPSHDEEPPHSPRQPSSVGDPQDYTESEATQSLQPQRENQEMASPPAPRELRRHSAPQMERSVRGCRGGARDGRRHSAIQPIPERETRASMAARHAAAMPMTRSSRRRSEDESRPAKRLRR